eukprot:CAMPEP_0183448400 /NCGR_PEP_ID=MMETSP0370-20130417/106156_1 /TAXON_ID=268820 /ORGANISM="Peridinium aciculiferum, Strain PAER-2" /LENGTH=93 /DNA_ID=CAMNT_0025639359 /DNA_START=15 /DNA_END=292 /DNA_ORIENTATION=+
MKERFDMREAVEVVPVSTLSLDWFREGLANLPPKLPVSLLNRPGFFGASEHFLELATRSSSICCMALLSASKLAICCCCLASCAAAAAAAAAA